MTDMPETAWLAPQRYGRPGARIGTWSEWKAYDTTEYVRGDIHQALQAEKEELDRENQLQAREVDATRRRADKWQSMVMDCQEYLKPGETPKKRMERDQNDILGLMKLLEKEKRRSEALQAEKEALETELEWMRDAIANPPLQEFDDWFSAEYPSIPNQCREYAIANRAFNAGHKAGRAAIDEN